jgi:hypothetical protein
MSDAIQRNAASIMAISLQLFSHVVSAHVNKPMLLIAAPAVATSPRVPSNCGITAALITA